MLFTSRYKLESKLSEIIEGRYFSYGKSRVSGSNNLSYFMHGRSTCMPGRKDIFVISSANKPREITERNMIRMSRAYKREKYNYSYEYKGHNYIFNNVDDFTYDQFEPYSDESLNIAVIASYKQVYGNLKPMESEIPKELERRLRNGDIPIREFIRGLAKSDFYLDNFVNQVSQKASIKLRFMHILGRPIFDDEELIKNINIIFKEGIYAHIDYLIDSTEYTKQFGENIVPFQRCWNSPYGMKTSSFVKTASYRKGFASSDNVIKK